jgi:hypothetical protein
MLKTDLRHSIDLHHAKCMDTPALPTKGEHI